jgi:sulfate adenylyltransferase
VSHNLIEPHGGALTDLMVDQARAEEIQAISRDWPSLDLGDRQICDLELLLNGGFSPLTGFMTKAEYDGVCADMRLPDGTLWPIPIVLDVSED